jgi:NAD+ synthase
MSTQSRPNAELLAVDPEREVYRIADSIREQVFHTLRRRGAVLGLSGGLDSSVCAAICVRALGADRVLGLLMPERDSSKDSSILGQLVAERLGIRTILEDMTPVLEAAGCYRRRDDAIRTIFPEYGDGYKSKIVLPSGFVADQYRLFTLVVQAPDGTETRLRLTADAYLGIVAATNFKQRARKMMEYHYGDRLQYAVIGTPNLVEFDQGFFVKAGDGAADLKPIAHLYKTQVYQLAEWLGIPEEIRHRPPTTDTFSLPQSQVEFYFSLPLEQLDLCLYGLNHDIAASDLAAHAGLTPAQVERAYSDIRAKRRVAAYLHMTPIGVV